MKLQSSKEIDLYQLSDCLSRVLPSPSVAFTDSGLVSYTTIKYPFRKGIKCIHPASLHNGICFACCTGAQFAKDIPVIAVIGDGSIMMNLQELESIRYHNLPIKIFIVNNNAYSIIRRRQRDLFRTRTIGTDPSNGISCPSFEKVANCFNMEFVSIESAIDLNNSISNVLKIEGPVLCEINGRNDQMYIETGLARNSNKKMVRRPLEDQKPFLPRDLFYAEMLIEPIDQ